MAIDVGEIYRAARPYINLAALFGIIMLAVPYMVWMERKVLAFFQQRSGPLYVGKFGLLQTIADGVKLLTKEELIPDNADRSVYIIAPMITMTTAFVVFSVIPLTEAFYVSDVSVGVLLVLAVSSIGVFGVILAGWSSGSKYPFLGAIRSCSQMISYELGLGVSLLIPVLLANTLSFRGISEWFSTSPFVQGGQWLYFVPLAIGWATFTVSALAETNRHPFDLPEAENELVAGYHTEYTSMKFAMFFLGEYVAIAGMCAIAVTAFLGSYNSPFIGYAWAESISLSSLGVWGKYWAQAGWWLVKFLLMFTIFIWSRATLPRFRFDQLQRFGWYGLLPLALFNVVLTATLVFGQGMGWF